MQRCCFGPRPVLFLGLGLSVRMACPAPARCEVLLRLFVYTGPGRVGRERKLFNSLREVEQERAAPHAGAQLDGPAAPQCPAPGQEVRRLPRGVTYWDGRTLHSEELAIGKRRFRYSTGRPPAVEEIRHTAPKARHAIGKVSPEQEDPRSAPRGHE